MKRVFIAGLLTLVLAVVAAPVTLTVTGGNAQLRTNVAQAANTCASTEVKVALKIFKSDPECIPNNPGSGGAIIYYLRGILKLLSGAVGLVVITMIVLGGVQYITSVADPARVKAAKERIQNAIIALVLYLMMFAILSFLIPGGILGN